VDIHRGNGAVVCAVEAASGRSAINVGKPSLTLSSWIMEEYKLMPEETMMVGDRLDTDVKFGNTGGMKISALVLTGCATATEIEESLLSEEKDAFGEKLIDTMPTIIFPHVGYMSK
jgi:ribonucleotide monophosphatase NagD (HAD superfamily)